MKNLIKKAVLTGVMVAMVATMGINSFAATTSTTTSTTTTKTVTLKQKAVYATIKSVSYQENEIRCLGSAVAYSPIYGNLNLNLEDYYLEVGDKVVIKGYELTSNYFYVSSFDIEEDTTIKTFTSSVSANRIYLTLSSGLKVEVCKIPTLWTTKILSTNVKLLKYFNTKSLQTFDFDYLEFMGEKINGINYIDLVDMKNDTLLNRASYKN